MKKEWVNLFVLGLGFVIISVVFGYIINNNISDAAAPAPTSSIAQSLGVDKLNDGLKGLSKYGSAASITPDQILKEYITIALGFVIFIAVGSIVYSGYLYMSAGGEEARVEKAKKSLIYSIIGIIISLLIYVIPVVVNNLLKL